jgi:hypothetical protein
VELSNTEIKIVVKNMAREMVKRATAKNASSLKEGDKVRKKNDPDRKGRIELITGGMAMVFWSEDQTTSGIALDKIEAANMIAKNALREVAVTYSDGTTITTSMAAHLSDADIKNYFRIGQEFNLGSGGKDKMVKVKSVKILNATVKNASKALNSGSYELVSLGGGMYRVQTPSGDLVKDRYGKPLKVSKENNGYAFRDGETLYTNRTKEEVLKYATARNADDPKFDGDGFLLDKNGRPFFVYNDTSAGLIIRKYKMMGINLTAEKDRTGNVYFKKV